MAAGRLGRRDGRGGRFRRLRQRGVAAGNGGAEDRGAGRLCAAHLNHQLRPEADDDERFVVELVPPAWAWRARWGAWRWTRLAAASGDGLEAAARTARYHFLRANRRPARRTVRGHRPHGRRSGRNDFAPDRSRHGHSRTLGHGAGPAAGTRHAASGRCWRSAARNCKPISTRSASPIATIRATPTCASRATASATRPCRSCASNSTPA